MTKKKRRDLAVIVGELQTAVKVENSNIITIGGLLIEAREQVAHGQWMKWLDDNFDSSMTSTTRDTSNQSTRAGRISSGYLGGAAAR